MMALFFYLQMEIPIALEKSTTTAQSVFFGLRNLAISQLFDNTG
jgi:hypothetical protein